MRGASALGKLLGEYRGADLRVLVIWLPVIASDKGPPSYEVRKPLHDPRVIEYWDPSLWASPKMMERARIMMTAAGEPPASDEDDIAWDLIARFPAGVSWSEPFPAPDWWHGPVVDALDPVRAHLAELQSSNGRD